MDLRIRRRVEIEIHTERLLVTGALESTCAECGGVARGLTIDQAAHLLRTDLPTICRLVQTGRVHFQQTAAGPPLICLTSLCAGAE